MAETATNPGRRAYWLSLLALAAALPAAIVVHTQGDVIDLLRQSMREPIEVARGATQEYGGGAWKTTEMIRLPGELPGTAVIVVQFEVTTDDPGRLASGPCGVTLTDREGRNWKPTFLLPRSVRETLPQIAERSKCGIPPETPKGTTLALAEGFVVPSDAQDLSLLVSLNTALPDRLRFR